MQSLPVVNVENACASASTAFHLAVNYVKAGAADVVLAVGRKRCFPRTKRARSAPSTGLGRTRYGGGHAEAARHGKGRRTAAWKQIAQAYSVFMDIYASMGACTCASTVRPSATSPRSRPRTHKHSVHNPLAQYQDPYSVDDILHAPPITYPLTLPMCSPISDGAAAAIVCSEAGFASLEASAQRAIRVLASVIQTGSDRPAAAFDRHLVRLGSGKAMSKLA